jgi:hypothetical protein
MSGHLQRLALSVLKPGGNIRPVLHSVFSAPKQRPVADTPWLAENEAATEAPVQPATRAPGVVPAPFETHASVVVPPPPPLVEEKTKSAALPEAPVAQSPTPLMAAEPQISVKRISEPPLPQQSKFASVAKSKETSAHQDVPASEIMDSHVEPAKVMVPRQPRTPSPRPDSSVPEPAGLVPATWITLESAQVENTRAAPPYMPLVPATAPGGEPTRIPPMRAPARPTAALKKAIAPRQSSESLAIRPDDVEIHIGRIEVTAVQPAAPKAPSRAARRLAPSLNDYLRGRDRRAS